MKQWYSIRGFGIAFGIPLTPLIVNTWSFGGRRRFYGFILGNVQVGFWRIVK